MTLSISVFHSRTKGCPLIPLLAVIATLLCPPSLGYGKDLLAIKQGASLITQVFTSGGYTAKFTLIDGDRDTKKIQSISVGNLDINWDEDLEVFSLRHPKVEMHLYPDNMHSWRWINGPLEGSFGNVECIPYGYLDIDYRDLPHGLYSPEPEKNCREDPLCHERDNYGAVQSHANSPLFNPIQLNTKNKDTVGVFEYFAAGTGVGRGWTKTHLFNLANGEYFTIEDHCGGLPEFGNDNEYHVTYSPPTDHGAGGKHWRYLCSWPDDYAEYLVFSLPIARTLYGAVDIDATRKHLGRTWEVLRSRFPLFGSKLSDNDLFKLAQQLEYYESGPYKYCIPENSSSLSDSEERELLSLLKRFFIHYTYDLLVPQRPFAHRIKKLPSSQARETLGWLQDLTEALLRDWATDVKSAVVKPAAPWWRFWKG